MRADRHLDAPDLDRAVPLPAACANSAHMSAKLASGMNFGFISRAQSVHGTCRAVPGTGRHVPGTRDQCPSFFHLVATFARRRNAPS